MQNFDSQTLEKELRHIPCIRFTKVIFNLVQIALSSGFTARKGEHASLPLHLPLCFVDLSYVIVHNMKTR